MDIPGPSISHTPTCSGLNTSSDGCESNICEALPLKTMTSSIAFPESASSVDNLT